eukprot:8783797-Pyramimonas_sp.AAC.1
MVVWVEATVTCLRIDAFRLSILTVFGTATITTKASSSKASKLSNFPAKCSRYSLEYLSLLESQAERTRALAESSTKLNSSGKGNCRHRST